MSDEEKKEEAARFAKRAASQGKAAAKNAGKAAKAAAEVAEEAVVDETQDALHKLEGTAEDVVDATRKLDPRLALAIAAVTLGGTYLVGRFVGYRNARQDIGEILTSDSID